MLASINYALSGSMSMGAVFAIREWLNLPVSSEVLMLRYAESGEPRILSMLYERCGNDLYHFLLVMTDADTAKDIAQRAWLKVMERKHMYQKQGRFEAWLFTLARHILIDDIRKHQRLTALCVEPEHDDSHAHDMPLTQALPAALAKLSFEQREAFCLQQEGFGLQEIANMVGENSETVKSRIRYAKQKLQTLLEAYHD